MDSEDDLSGDASYFLTIYSVQFFPPALVDIVCIMLFPIVMCFQDLLGLWLGFQ